METRISVRELVEFLEKSGDLDGRYTGRRETKARDGWDPVIMRRCR